MAMIAQDTNKKSYSPVPGLRPLRGQNKIAINKIAIRMIKHFEESCFPEAWSCASIHSGIEHGNFFIFIDDKGELFHNFGSSYAPKSHELSNFRAKGYAIIRFIAIESTIGNSMELLRLGVEPVFRRNGLAKKILLALDKISADNGIHKMLIELRENNFSARNLYQACGYNIVGKRKNYYNDSCNALIMEKIV